MSKNANVIATILSFRPIGASLKMLRCEQRLTQRGCC